MKRFYTEQTLAEQSEVTLCEQSFHHWIKVLRAKIGDSAILFNGLGGEYTAILTNVTNKSAMVSIKIFKPINRDTPYKVTLAIIMSKGDRMDYALQKATEMGVYDIQLLTSERCEVKLKADRLQKKMASWQSVVISACEQSGLNIMPRVHAPMAVADFIQQTNADIKLVLAPTEDGQANNPLHGIELNADSTICLLIGAEGGLTSDEIKIANQASFTSWCLGERILRTETAPVATLAYLQFHHDFYTIRS